MKANKSKLERLITWDKYSKMKAEICIFGARRKIDRDFYCWALLCKQNGITCLVKRQKNTRCYAYENEQPFVYAISFNVIF